MKEAVILAGGMGTRLSRVVPDVPKPMAPVADKPFLYYILSWLGSHGIGRMIISAGYRAETIVSYFGSSFNGIQVEYAIEEKPLGTGGAVIFALQKTSGEDIFIINGDTWFPVDLGEFHSFHTTGKNMFTIALKKMRRFSRYGSVECSGAAIIRFNEKKYCSEGLINGGIYIAGREYLTSLRMPEVFSLERDLLEKEAPSGMIKCRVFGAPFIDIGIPEDYKKAQSFFKSGNQII